MKLSKQIPSELYDRFTMKGLAEVEYRFKSQGKKTYAWPADELKEIIKKARNRESFAYPRTDPLFYQALDKYPVAGKRALVIGSQQSAYECILYVYGAEPVTFDYNEIETEWPETYTDWSKVPQCTAAVSISSIEHSGLGRYGDDLNPEGDIQMMKKIMDKLKPGSLFYLSVPVGEDKLVWNAHRIYGPHRLKAITEGWDQLDSFGLVKKGDQYKEVQPVIVLRRK